ncbi:MAG: hypothetical protein PHC54_04975 [Candidatus Omnitrophica bacterium]|nr:hypothetical protein [Candidatus Omnitrophota bacterium]MDD5592626.1 hypothetical protein [Candidatus Omnitrophota bacterium]
MLKKGLGLSLVLLFLLYLPVFAAEPQSSTEESFTITTYYPSPYGVYNQLQTNRFAVGDTNDSNGTLDAGDQPPENGQIAVARSVIYKPVDKDTLSNPQLGEVIYSDNALWIYTNKGWGKLSAQSNYESCIGYCTNSDIASCPSGQGYTMIASTSGCGSFDTGTELGLGYRIYARVDSVTTGNLCFEKYCTVVEWPSNRVLDSEKCETKYFPGYMSQPQITSLSSSCAACCK